MFKKYYKEANDDIRPRDGFVDEVISNLHKKKPPKGLRAYYKYAPAAAAAVMLVSAAVIAMPFFGKAPDGVIIEEPVTVTSAPDKGASANLPVNASDAKPAEVGQSVSEPRTEKKPEDVKIPVSDARSFSPEKNNTSTHSYTNTFGDLPVASKKSETTDDDALPQPPLTFRYYTAESSLQSEENPQPTASPQTEWHTQSLYIGLPDRKSAEKEDEKSKSFDEAADAAAVLSGVAESVTDDNEGVAQASAADKFDKENDGERGDYGSSDDAPAAGASSASTSAALPPESGVSQDAANLSASAPSETAAGGGDYYIRGYDCSVRSPSYYLFVSDSGGEITLCVDADGKSDCAPVYDESDGSITVYFAVDGVSYSINAENADMSSVEELVGQIY